MDFTRNISKKAPGEMSHNLCGRQQKFGKYLLNLILRDKMIFQIRRMTQRYNNFVSLQSDLCAGLQSRAFCVEKEAFVSITLFYHSFSLFFLKSQVHFLKKAYSPPKKEVL